MLDQIKHMSSYHWNDRWAFLLLIIPVLLIAYYIWRYRKIYPELKLSAFDGIRKFTSPFRGALKPFGTGLRVLALVALIAAIARPQSLFDEEKRKTEGIDIVLALDISGSMLAQDFKPDRLGAAKDVAAQFVDARLDDRIGLVVFAGESFGQCPLTIDHNEVKLQLSEIKQGILEDGTAIGNGLATAVDKLKDSEAKSKVIILLTDGVNNRGEIDPTDAAQLAQLYGIKVYTIGVGTMGTAPYPVQTPWGPSTQQMPVEIDEELLSSIGQNTGGQYFRATNNKTLSEIYQHIDRLEKTEVEVTQITNRTERFHWLVVIALCSMVLEFFTRNLFARSIP